MSAAAKVPTTLLPAQVTRIAMGVRYQPQYSVTDFLGTIVDRILRAKGSPFTPDYFPFSRATPSGHILLSGDDPSDRVLQINQQDTILQVPLGARDTTVIARLAQQFEAFILGPIRDITGIGNVIRYGVVLHFDNCGASMPVTPIKRFLGDDFPNTRQLSLQLIRRMSTEEALVRRDVNDYAQAIYSFDQSEDGQVNLSLDSQRMFEPALDTSEWASRPFVSFVDRSLTFIAGESARLLPGSRSLSEAS